MSSSSILRETKSLLSSTSVFVKALTGTILVGYLLSFLEGTVKSISVTPGYFWPPHFWLWTAFTHCFLEIHLWEVLLDLVVIFVVGKLLEPLWGALETAVFFFVVNVGVAMTAAFFYYFLYMVTFNTQLLFNVHIHGLSGYIAGVCVAVKQTMPDHVLYRSPLGKITNRHVPLVVFVFSLILWGVRIVQGSYCTMVGSGLVVSWIYLRFYQVHSNGTKGDMADSFAFPTFFPTVLQPPIALVCNTIFAILVKLRLCKKPVRKYDIGASSTSSISISLPGVESHDTERRRQIALKALSERLNRSDSTGPEGAASGPAKTHWPDLEDEEETGEKTALLAMKEDSPPLESVHVAKPVDKESEAKKEDEQNTLITVATTTS